MSSGTVTLTMTSTWWEDLTAPEASGTPMGELIGGLDEIGAEPIPYGRLPTRARTVYSPQFSTWSDLAGETIASLLRRPKGGTATVRAIVAAARAAATAGTSPAKAAGTAAMAAANLLDRLTERDRIVLSDRVWVLRPASRREVAARLGVHADSLPRIQSHAEAGFAELRADPAHRDLIAFAQRLGRQLGPLARVQTVDAALAERGLEYSDPAARLLLYLAGPYTQWRDDWLTTTSNGRRCAALAALDAAVERWGAPSTGQLVSELVQVGVPEESARDFVENGQDSLRRFGDRWVRWGASVADQAEAILHLREVPTAVDAIAAAIGRHCPPRAVRYAISKDARFVRASRTTWALRRWGLGEYSGLFAAIAERIDAHGGTIGATALLEDLMVAFPDVAERSIRTYLSAPGFVTERGLVRRRTEADGWPPAPPLSSARGAFSNGANEIRLTVAVTAAVLRGSGQFIHAAVARALGVCPGQQRVFAGPHGDLRIGWLLSSTSGAAVGSLRPLAAAVAAREGDTLVLVFDLDEASVDAERIRPGDDPGSQRKALLGRSTPDPAAGFARSLDCRPADVVAVLQWRGDAAFTELVE